MPMDINFNNIKLVLKKKRMEEFGEGVSQIIKRYDILLENKKVGEIETLETSLGLNYVSYIGVNPAFRGKGIGGYLLKKYFRGFFISAGNQRVQSLYNRLGRNQNKFTNKENKLLARNMGMWGTWRIK